ncbi:electron transfer flavoprotein subunit alpha/FixB family protein [Devosia ginsengisoli]|uniref:Electron transfer flavoprotein subunit alpha n=1 Tax=Devosia ginsengisoli TaxID=400770 RepID=A0A5B8LQB5_9HYPH|nr:FAD-binding protein [Devosia ginsengisoli]QDZ10236.1 electron transfer flavoprotein subunit alpha/FixB family protein [Devosia ginsengisoli]
MATLLIAEHDNTNLSDLTARALTAACAMQAPVTLLVAGSNCKAVAEQAARLDGVEKVLVADAPHLAQQAAEPMGALIAELARDFQAVLAVASSTGKSVLPRAAALLDVMQVSEVTRIESPDTFVRPIYAGNAIETIQSSDPIKVITVRSSAFEPAGQGDASAPITAVAVPDDMALSAFERQELAQTDRPDLGSARIVISGGRAFGSKETFDRFLEPIAAKLGAAIGASRAAVDSGYAGNELQVGQTGKVVAPDLYIACGISGAIQHLAGMKDSRYIVAINKDADAPIFQVADYGLVGDLFEILPELESKL